MVLNSFIRGDYDAANAVAQTGLKLFKEFGEPGWIGGSYGLLALIAIGRGDYDAATDNAQQALALAPEITTDRAARLRMAWEAAGLVATHRRDFALAWQYFREGLAQAAYRARLYGSWLLVGVSALLREEGSVLEAVQLLTFLQEDYATSPQHQRWVADQLEGLEGELALVDFADAQAQGRELTYDEVVDWLLDDTIAENRP